MTGVACDPVWEARPSASLGADSTDAFSPAVGAVGQHEPGAHLGPSPTSALDLPGIQELLKYGHFVTLSRAQPEGYGPPGTVTLQVDLGAEAALRPTEGFVPIPFFAPAAL
ncbi:hypothetical protein GCM10008956_00010 [Deinococcus arenae]|uniref:Uncharacterized protein n=1 Tax=Deinococcus arenae TaxID=1452751 RepID=A0A8H9GHD4_9DEIO|nr:hypothetical protein GCM10008956_00010 [Deinococcus arenae]